MRSVAYHLRTCEMDTMKKVVSPELKALRPWTLLLKRLRSASRAVSTNMSDTSTNMKILFRRWNGGAVLRQARINGFQVLVRANEDHGRQVYCLGRYEEEDSNFIRQVIRETDVCMDIGANVGYYSVLLASQAKRGWVHSFEPIALNYHLLCANLLLNGLSNVTVNCCAVGDKSGETEFVVAQDSGFSSLLDTGRKSVLATTRVPIDTIDSYCERNRIRRVDFVKADVEGAEPLVLAGAAGILRDPLRRPRMIVLELFPPMLLKYGSTASSVIRCIEKFGYEAFVVDGQHRHSYEESKADRFYNVFFEHREGDRWTCKRTRPLLDPGVFY